MPFKKVLENSNFYVGGKWGGGGGGGCKKEGCTLRGRVSKKGGVEFLKRLKIF